MKIDPTTAIVLFVEASGWPTPVRELRFGGIEGNRRWRFDLAWPTLKLAVEVEGGVWTGGRHTRGVGYAADCRKYSEAAILGWRVLRFTTQQVHDGEHVELLRVAFDG